MMSTETPVLSILVVTNMYPPHHYGGYELSCWDVMRRLQTRGHWVIVLTTDRSVHYRIPKRRSPTCRS